MRPLVFEGSLTVRTGADLRAAIEGAAAREGSTASTWVRSALKQAAEQGAARRQAHALGSEVNEASNPTGSQVFDFSADGVAALANDWSV